MRFFHHVAAIIGLSATLSQAAPLLQRMRLASGLSTWARESLLYLQDARMATDSVTFAYVEGIKDNLRSLLAIENQQDPKKYGSQVDARSMNEQTPPNPTELLVWVERSQVYLDAVEDSRAVKTDDTGAYIEKIKILMDAIVAVEKKEDGKTHDKLKEEKAGEPVPEASEKHENPTEGKAAVPVAYA